MCVCVCAIDWHENVGSPVEPDHTLIRPRAFSRDYAVRLKLFNRVPMEREIASKVTSRGRIQ